MLEKLRITVDAAHILRWTSTSSIEADGVVRRIPAGGIVLDHDQMLPRIAKVLLVDKGSRQYWRDLMQADAGIGKHDVLGIKPLLIGNAVEAGTDAELVEMIVLSAHGRLNRPVQLAQPDRGWGAEAAPHRPGGAEQGNRELVAKQLPGWYSGFGRCARIRCHYCGL